MTTHPVASGTFRVLRQRSWGQILRSIILPAGDRLFGQQMISRLRFLEQAQWWDQARLYAHRDQLLRSLIMTAYQEVPFYQTLLDSCHVRPEDVRTAADLRCIPSVTKAMLRAKYPQGTTRQTGQRPYEIATSGSTGANFRLLEDAQTAGWYRASFLLALEWAGWRVGEAHVQTGMTLHRSLDRKLKDLLLNCHYISAFDLSTDKLDITLSLLERYDIQHLWGYPGSLYYLARRAQERGWNQSLRSVVTWGDNLYPHYRQTIEQAFGMRVSDTYGCGEGIQVSAQCEHGTYHQHMLDVIVEYVDDNNLPVSPGTPGHILLTRLHPGVMPLIRYRVGDIGVSGGENATCLCGRKLDVMQSIQGRDTDVIITPRGNRLIVHFFTGLLEHFPEIDTFQVVQEQPDAIILRVVVTPAYVPETAQRIIETLHRHGADGLTVHIEPVETIPLTPGGKRRFIINKLTHTGQTK